MWICTLLSLNLLESVSQRCHHAHCVSLELTINGQSCLESLEYFSSKKLVCLSPDIIGKSQIIVTTRLGGEGTCLVHFIGLEPELQPVLGEGLVKLCFTLGKGHLRDRRFGERLSLVEVLYFKLT